MFFKLLVITSIYIKLVASTNLNRYENKMKKFFNKNKNVVLLDNHKTKRCNIDLFIELNFWIDNKENMKELINKILYNNLRYVPLKKTASIISNIYQYYLYKKTLFRTTIMKSMINKSDAKTRFLLNNFENNITFTILKQLTEIESFLATIKNIDVLTLYNDYLKKDGVSIFFKIIKLKANLSGYIKSYRKKISADFYCDFDKDKLEFFIVKHNFFISSMIEVFCKTIFTIENEQIKELIVLANTKNDKIINTGIDLTKTIENIYCVLDELSCLIFYNTDKYNRFINNNIKKLKNVLNFTFCSINSKKLTDIAIEILSDNKIVKQKKEKKKDFLCFYYLLNKRDANKIDFADTKEKMLKCCLTEFSRLKVFTINLKSFYKYRSVLDHIKISIEIDLELSKDYETHETLLYCKCRLIPIPINIENFDDNFKICIFRAMETISKYNKTIILRYKEHNFRDANRSFDENCKYYNIIGPEDSFIIYFLSEKNQIYEVLKLEVKAFGKCDIHGSLMIYWLYVTMISGYYQSNNDICYYRKTKKTQLYPIYESTLRFKGDKKKFFFCNYIYNPEFKILQQKSIIIYDLMFKIVKLVDLKNIIFDTKKIINDWSELNILYNNVSGGFYNIVPFKYVSSWMSYITFRSILHNNLTLTEKNTEYLYTIITRYEVNSMSSDPFYYVEHTEYKKSLIQNYCIFWSDKTEELQERDEIKKAVKKFHKCLYANLNTYKFQLLIENKSIGLDDMVAINAETSIAKIFETLESQTSSLIYTVKKNETYKLIRRLLLVSS